MDNNFRNFRIMAKVCLILIFLFVLVHVFSWVFLQFKKFKGTEGSDTLDDIIKKIQKVFKVEIIIPLVLYMFNISIMAFDLGALILFILGLCGLGALIFAEIRGAEENFKLIRDIGMAVWHVTTLVMLIVMTARVDYFSQWTFR